MAGYEVVEVLDARQHLLFLLKTTQRCWGHRTSVLCLRAAGHPLYGFALGTGGDGHPATHSWIQDTHRDLCRRILRYKRCSRSYLNPL